MGIYTLGKGVWQEATGSTLRSSHGLLGDLWVHFADGCAAAAAAAARKAGQGQGSRLPSETEKGLSSANKRPQEEQR